MQDLMTISFLIIKMLPVYLKRAGVKIELQILDESPKASFFEKRTMNGLLDEYTDYGLYQASMRMLSDFVYQMRENKYINNHLITHVSIDKFIRNLDDTMDLEMSVYVITPCPVQ